jgi:hypothetical protein
MGPLFGVHKRPGGTALTLLGFDFGAKQGKGVEAKRQ